jgi:hypothetical protein
MIETDDPDVLLLLGQDALEQGDRATALLHWRRAAERGNRFAAVRAGLVLEADDPAAAAALFRRAVTGTWCFVSRAESDALVLARSRLEHLTARHPGL